MPPIATNTAPLPPGVDLLDLDAFARQEHHDMFRALREQQPVSWHPEPNGSGFWSVVRHDDLVKVNRDTTTFSSQLGGTQLMEPTADFDTRGVIMLDSDPPQHTRYRLLVNKGFTPRMIGLLESHLRYRTELIVDRVIESGACEFVGDLASELPLQAIADIMGVPQEDRHLLFEWSNRMIGAQDPDYGEGDGETDARNAAMELYAYSNQLREARVNDPKDDIVTKLINAEINGERLSELEFDMFMLLLSVAGNETTRNATSHGMLALMQNPDEFARLRDDAGLLDSAVEEIVRWATPVLHFRRTASTDTSIRGQEIAGGDKVLIWHISANRDETVFDDPFRFDVGRTPNDHVGFGGGGAHFCLGANLARMELRLVFREICDRMGDMTLAGDVGRLRSNFIGGIKSMPVQFTPGARKHPTP